MDKEKGLNERVSEIYSIESKIKALQEKRKVLIDPALSDLSLLEEIYNLTDTFYFLAQLSKKDVAQRFIFLSMLLYSPASIVGYPLAKGLRGRLSKVLGYKSDTAVSNNLVSATDAYNIYSEYRESIGKLYEYVTKKMKEKDE